MFINPITRVALDAFYGTEHREDEIRPNPLVGFLNLDYPRRVDDDLDDSYVGLSVWQWFMPGINVFSKFGLRNGDAGDFLLDVNGAIPKVDMSYDVSYKHQFDSREDIVNDLTGYYRVLGTYEEYDNLLVSLHKPLNKMFTVSVEGEFHGSDASRFTGAGNRDYNRYAVILAADDLMPKLDASIGLEYWDLDQSENTWAVTGEVSKTWERFKLTIGADYQAYEDHVVRYNPWPHRFDRFFTDFVPGYYAGTRPLIWVFDTYTVETHENVHSIYGRLKYDLAQDQDLSLKVTYEEDEAPEYSVPELMSE